MAFSFNPAQSTATGIPQASIQAPGGSTREAPPSVPDSPFLFMRHRDQEMSINAYLQLLLVLIATLSVAASIVMFAYAQYLSMGIESKKTELASKEDTFKVYPFDEMTSLSGRFATLEKILKGYVSSRSPLKFLEKVVENQVVFNDFTFVSNTKGNTMGFSIITGSQRALIQQLDALNLREYSKVVPAAKMESFSDTGTFFKAKVSAPVFVQGVLSDEVLFIAPSGTSTSQVSTNTTTSVTNP